MRVLLLAIGVVLIGGTLYWYSGSPTAQNREPSQEVSPEESGGESVIQEPQKEMVTVWDFRFIEDGVSDLLAPQTDVGISFVSVVDGDPVTVGPYRLGSFDGSCAEQPLQSGEIGAALCWFAGFGTRIQASVAENSIVVTRTDIEEGTAEIVSVLQEPHTMLTVPL